MVILGVFVNARRWLPASNRSNVSAYSFIGMVVLVVCRAMHEECGFCGELSLDGKLCHWDDGTLETITALMVVGAYCVFLRVEPREFFGTDGCGVGWWNTSTCN